MDPNEYSFIKIQGINRENIYIKHMPQLLQLKPKISSKLHH